MTVTVLHGDCRAVLPTLPAASVQCCVTSPPYYGLRSYLPDGHPEKHLEIGLEATPDEYVAEMVAVFREVRRVLRDDGVLFLNIGDSYAAGGMGPGSGKQLTNVGANIPAKKAPPGYKPKDLLGIPWLLAFALRADGWYLRSDIIWAKSNPMPESVRDRPTSAHEHVFLLTKSTRYFYDAAAIAEPLALPGAADGSRVFGGRSGTRNAAHGDRTEGRAYTKAPDAGRNARNVWTIAAQPYRGAHFATMPPSLAERCIKAGTKPGDVVLDPFGGAGTTGLVADRLRRNAVLIELNPDYRALAIERVREDAGLLAGIA